MCRIKDEICTACSKAMRFESHTCWQFLVPRQFLHCLDLVQFGLSSRKDSDLQVRNSYLDPVTPRVSTRGKLVRDDASPVADGGRF